MLELVFANLRVRPFRTLISVIGVALGVVLVILFTGLARGMTNDVAKRAANWKAEIVFTRPGGMDSMSSNAAVNIGYVAKLREIEGVSSTVPVIRYITPDNRGRWGVRQIDGVEWQPFADMNGMTIVSGRAPQANDEIIMDEREMIDNKLKVGDSYELFGGKPYKITGIFSPPSGARIKMSLAGMQEALQTDKCTYILVKLKDGADVDAVAAKINEVLPGNKINLTRDLVIDAQERIPGLGTFLKVLVVLGALVSTVFVLLSMYTTITERRKEIGILKSLGASTSFIIKVIEGEAFMIGILGIALGGVASAISSYLINKQFDLAFEFSSGWIITAVLIAIGGSLVGALYPAWRAAGIDPVEVMVNE
ncbi:MAG TPA: ABC transporter permease [Pyrinomonadaceae bacterium]|nr:ABC transporter permease [Pyrinomonadaceae bacterium]